MKTIHKYVMPLGGEAAISLPVGAEILCVKEQYGQLAMYVKLETSNVLTELRRFLIVGTGYPIPAATRLDYIDTVMLMSGQLVLHVFETLP